MPGAGGEVHCKVCLRSLELFSSVLLALLLPT